MDWFLYDKGLRLERVTNTSEGLLLFWIDCGLNTPLKCTPAGSSAIMGWKIFSRQMDKSKVGEYNLVLCFFPNECPCHGSGKIHHFAPRLCTLITPYVFTLTHKPKWLQQRGRNFISSLLCELKLDEYVSISRNVKAEVHYVYSHLAIRIQKVN